MKKTNLKILVLLILLSFSFTFVCFKYSTLNFQDEWVGRGLYPGLAFFHGLDFYEPQTGPHVSLYGWSTGLFYSMCGFANTPNQAISLAFMINLFFLISLIVLLFWKSINLTIKCNILSVSIISSLTCLLTFISLMDGTTDAIFKIHADMPAMSFLVLSIIFFRSYIVKKTKFFLFLTVLNLILSVWAKLPTLPALVFPILYLVSEKKFKDIIFYIFFCIGTLLLSILFITLAYGLDDTKFILFDHIAANQWSDRNLLFNGEKATLVTMTYFEAIPLLFRFLAMYITDYWFFGISAILCLVISFSNKFDIQEKFLFKSLGLIYSLTLPSCLAALSHFGSVENALFFANFTGILCMLALLITMLKYLTSPIVFAYVIGTISLFCALPILRQANGIEVSSNLSAHQQAYEYLKAGNNDIYFGWYPIAHLMVDGESFTSIESPTWVGMTKPEMIDFSTDHFPKDAKYLATCKIGYGRTILQRYLGVLDEVDAPESISSWRIFLPVEKIIPSD